MSGLGLPRAVASRHRRAGAEAANCYTSLPGPPLAPLRFARGVRLTPSTNQRESPLQVVEQIGGVLVPDPQADDLIAQLKKEGIETAARVGEVVAADKPFIRVV